MKIILYFSFSFGFPILLFNFLESLDDLLLTIRHYSYIGDDKND